MNPFIVLQQMLILCSMMAVGFIITKLGLLPGNSSKIISGLVVYIFNPFLAISSVLGKSLKETGSLFWENVCMAVAFYLIMFLLGLILVFLLRPHKSDKNIYRLLMLLPNCGFMGIPVVLSLLGPDYIVYVSVYMLLFNITLYSLGFYMIDACGDDRSSSAKKPGSSLKGLFLNAGVISSLIAIGIFLLGIDVPAPVADFCSYLGNPCVPLSMILIGCSVANGDIRSMLKNIRMYIFVLLKMLLIPIVFTFLVPLLPFDSMILKLFIIMLCMPSGTLVVLAIEERGGNSTLASNGVILTTISAIITIPIVSFFIQ